LIDMSVNKEALQRYCEGYRSGDVDLIQRATNRFYAVDANINVVHPFNQLSGSELYFDQFVKPLSNSLAALTMMVNG